MRALPRKRIARALESGEADLVCDYQSAWLPGPFAWSRGFIPDQTVLVTAAKTPAPPRLAAVAGQPVGTVLGYAYPEAAQVLGAGLVRDDAPDAVANLRKLELGRVQHVLTGRRLLDYRRRAAGFALPVHPPHLGNNQRRVHRQREAGRGAGPMRPVAAQHAGPRGARCGHRATRGRGRARAHPRQVPLAVSPR
jgi:ABC-type amino acid transport substrate-binding protein